MKKFKYVFVFLLLLLQLQFLIGCKNSKSTDNLSELYKITDSVYDITDFYDVKQAVNGQFLVHTLKTENFENQYIQDFYTSKLSYINYKENTIDECKYNLPRNNAPLKSCCDENGNLIILSQDYNSVRKIYKFSPDGELLSETEYEKIPDSFIIVDMYAYKDETIVVYDNGIKKMNSGEEILFENILFSGEQKTQNNLYLYLVLYNEDETFQPYYTVIKYDISENKIIWQQDYPTTETISFVCFDYQNNILLYSNGTDIKSVNAETGEIVKTVCNIYDYVSPFNIIYLISGESGLYLLTQQDINSGIVQVLPVILATQKEIDELKNPDDKTVLTIRACYTDKLLVDAVKVYETENNVKVNFDFYSNDSLADSSAYIQNTNAALLSGDCNWDILMLYNLDYDLYASKGYFTDLYTLGAKELKESGDYFNHIIENCEIDGKLYVFPNNIQYISLYTNIDMYENILESATSWDEIFANFEKNASDSDYLFSQNIYSINQYSLTGIGIKINEMMTGGMEKSEAVAMLANDLSIAAKANDPRYTMTASGSEDSGRAVFEAYCSGVLSPEFAGLDLKNITIINMPTANPGEPYYFNLLNGMAVLNTSKNQREAYTLIKYISKNKISYSGNINRDLFDMNIDQELAPYLNNSMPSYNFTEEDKIEIKRIAKEYEASFERVSAQYAAIGPMQIVREEADKLAEGLINAEKAAENIYDRLWLYYNE